MARTPKTTKPMPSVLIPPGPNLTDFDNRATVKFTRGQIGQALQSSEIQEAKVTISIGDSNGSLDNFLKNLGVNVIGKDGKWAAGNKRVIIHGDILADRETEGFQILEKISQLRKEAREAGGDIAVIAGNHEDLMLSFLLNRGGVYKDIDTVVGNCMIGSQQGRGLAELTLFTGDRQMVDDLFKATDPDNYRMDRDEILGNMRTDEYGLMILNEIASMKLCEQIEDTLYVHTDPTDTMLQMILDKGADRINDEFHAAIREPLLNGAEFDKKNNALFDTFLNTNNRTFVRAKEKADKSGAIDIPTEVAKTANINRDLLKQLKAKGINRMVFGHSNMRQGNRIINIEGIEFVNVDQGGYDDTLSAAEIPRAGRKSGRVRTGTEIFKDLNLTPPPAA